MATVEMRDEMADWANAILENGGDFAEVLEKASKDYAPGEAPWESGAPAMPEPEPVKSSFDPNKVEVGSIFRSSFGYDMTIVEYFEVVGFTPSGKSVKVREIGYEVVEGDAGYTGSCRPVPGAFLEDKPVLTKRLGGSPGHWSIKIESYGRWAYLEDPDRTSYFNYMD